MSKICRLKSLVGKLNGELGILLKDDSLVLNSRNKEANRFVAQQIGINLFLDGN